MPEANIVKLRVMHLFSLSVRLMLIRESFLKYQNTKNIYM